MTNDGDLGDRTNNRKVGEKADLAVLQMVRYCGEAEKWHSVFFLSGEPTFLATIGPDFDPDVRFLGNLVISRARVQIGWLRVNTRPSRMWAEYRIFMAVIRAQSMETKWVCLSLIDNAGAEIWNYGKYSLDLSWERHDSKLSAWNTSATRNLYKKFSPLPFGWMVQACTYRIQAVGLANKTVYCVVYPQAQPSTFIAP